MGADHSLNTSLNLRSKSYLLLSPGIVLQVGVYPLHVDSQQTALVIEKVLAAMQEVLPKPRREIMALQPYDLTLKGQNSGLYLEYWFSPSDQSNLYHHVASEPAGAYHETVLRLEKHGWKRLDN